MLSRSVPELMNEIGDREGHESFSARIQRLEQAEQTFSQALFDLDQEKFPGFNEDVWKFLEQNSQELTHRLSASARSRLSHAALDAGFLSLAQFDWHTETYWAAKVAVQSNDHFRFRELRELLRDRPLEMALVDTIQRRKKGQFQLGIEIYQQELLPNVSKMTDLMKAETLGCGASLYFNSSDFEKAFDLYSQAFQIYDVLVESGKKAIASFNASIALENLEGRELDADRWLAKSESTLREIQLPSLFKSIRLTRIHSLLMTGVYERSGQMAREFLAIKGLSSTQKFWASTYLIRSYLGLLQIKKAKTAYEELNVIMIQENLNQFDKFHLALGLEIDAHVHSSTVTRKLKPKDFLEGDLRAISDLRIASLYFDLFCGESSRAQKQWHSLQKMPRAILRHIPCVQIEKVVNGFTGEICEPAALVVAELISSIHLKDLAHLQKITEEMAARKNSASYPWYSAVENLAQAYWAYFSGQTVGEFAEKAYQKLDFLGLDRLVTYASALLAATENVNYSSSESKEPWPMRWARLPEQEKIILERHLSPLLGSRIFRSTWVLEGRGLISSSPAVPKMTSSRENTLVIDGDRQKVIYQGSELNIKPDSILYQLVQELFRSGANGLSKEKLVEKLWGYEYNPIAHDAMIYTNIGRLREYIPVSLVNGNYKFPMDLKVVMTAQSSIDLHAENMSHRQRKIFSYFKEHQNEMIQRSDIVRIFEVSPRTALRDLDCLCQKKLIFRTGEKRGVSYQLRRMV